MSFCCACAKGNFKSRVQCFFSNINVCAFIIRLYKMYWRYLYNIVSVSKDNAVCSWMYKRCGGSSAVGGGGGVSGEEKVARHRCGRTLGRQGDLARAATSRCLRFTTYLVLVDGRETSSVDVWWVKLGHRRIGRCNPSAEGGRGLRRRYMWLLRHSRKRSVLCLHCLSNPHI